MTSAEEYRQQVSNLGLDRMKIEASSVAEAKAAVGKVRRLQKELGQIKAHVNLEMKTIRAAYKQKIAEAGSSGLTGLLAMGRGGGKLRASEKRRVRAERDGKLAAYDQVKLTIDDLIVQLNRANLQLQDFVEEAKKEGKAQKQTAKAKPTTKEPSLEKRFCPQCGKGVGARDAFCRSCGHRLSSA